PFREGIVELGRDPVLGATLLARAAYAEPRREHFVVLELTRRKLDERSGLAEALSRGVGRATLEAEAAYAAGLLELLRARGAETGAHAARALILLERAAMVRPVFHAARLHRALAKSLL